MARRTAKRRSSRRRRPLRQNPLTTKQKIGVVGGLVVVGGVAAYALTASASAPTGPTGPIVDPRAAKQAECNALRASLATLRAQPMPDAATMLRIEAQIATCQREARELGVAVEAAQEHLSNADQSFAAMEGWFNEYRATSEHDPLKRNNTRQSILNAGEALAATYTNALNQTSSPEAIKMIAQSLVRALDASISRRICFWNGTPGPGGGCGTLGGNEAQPDEKAMDERNRVTVRLLAAYDRAVTKAGGPSRALTGADGEQFLAAILRPSANLKTWIDGQFAHYKATDAGWDPLKRNNTRQSILAAGREMVAGLRDVFNFAVSFGSVTSLRAVGALTISALNASIDRWACFFTGTAGCGTFVASEAQPDVKAAEEMANTAVPLMALYTQIAQALTARGASATARVVGFDTDVPAIQPLITAKLRICKTMNDAIGAQFAHYKATDVSDFAKRNNTRGWMLATGASLATCLQQTLDAAVGPAKAAARGVSGLMGVGSYTGLGQTAPAPFIPMLLTSVPTSVLIRPVTTTTAPVVPKVNLSILVRPIAAVAAAALDAAIQRKLCYLHDLGGCGRSGVSEAHGFDKAAEEQARVISPLIGVLKNTTLADPGSAAAVGGLLTASLVKEVTAEKKYIDTTFARYKDIRYEDWLQRDNVRKAMIAAGQRMVTTLRTAAAAGSKAKIPLQNIAKSALEASRAREACYRSGASGCDQQWGLFFEGSGGQKADQEAAEIMNPLTALLADRTAAGLGSLGDESGEIFGMSRFAWGVALGVIGGAAALGMFSRKPVRNNRKRRRTSRRLSA